MKIIEILGPTGAGKTYLSKELSNIKNRNWFVQEVHEDFKNKLILKYLKRKANSTFYIKNVNPIFLHVCRQSLNSYNNRDSQYFHAINKLYSALKRVHICRLLSKNSKIIIDEGLAQKVFFVNPNYSKDYMENVTNYFRHLPPIDGLIILKVEEENIFQQIKDRKSKNDKFGSELIGLEEKEIIPVLKKYNLWCEIAHRELTKRDIPVINYAPQKDSLQNIKNFINLV